MIDLYPACVVAKFKLAKCLVERVGQGELRLCNCVNSQISESYPWAEGQMGKGSGP